MKATPEGCELRNELMETKAAVASLDTRLTKVESDVGIVAADLYDEYLAAQDFKEDDPDFVAGKAALKAQLGWTDEKVESVLATCILEN
jgi:hypothetical protein